MIEASARRIQEQLSDADRVLDVGGWAKPFNRADWVIDRLPYETRGRFGHDGHGPERFTARTWIERDICDRTPFPFDDKSFDFAICSHTLEDIRDPVWVCSEIARVAKAGYIEVPSRLAEQSYGVQGPWVGWGHHHWLVDISPTGLEFVFKHHVLSRPTDHFPLEFYLDLAEDERVETLWWEGNFEYRERVLENEELLDPYLGDFVRDAKRRRGWPRPMPPRPSRRREIAHKLDTRPGRLGRWPARAWMLTEPSLLVAKVRWKIDHFGQ